MVNTKDLEVINTIRLLRSENVGTKTFWHLLALYKTASNAIEQLPNLSLRGGKCINICSKTQAEDEIAKCVAQKVQIISHFDHDFPKLLKNIDDCPPILFGLGDTSLLNKTTIGVVGSRNASANGLRFAYKLAQDLTQNGNVVVSGFARGIDNAAHKASVENSTIAVLAGGVDHIYPPEYKDLYYEIAEKSLIVAELPLGSIPKAQNFPQRNRIISGLSYGVAIVEANLKSGSLITAKYAASQNRDVFAVPGFPLDPRYHGNNYLLKQGAYLLESAEDIFEVIENNPIKRTAFFEQQKSFLHSPKNNIKTDFSEKELTQARREIINLISTSPTSIDEIINISQLPIGLVLTVIIELELAGKIIRHFGNQISITIDLEK